MFSFPSKSLRVAMGLTMLGMLSACSNTGPTQPGNPNGTTNNGASASGTESGIYSGSVDSLDGAYDTRIGDYVYDANAPQSSFVNNAPPRSPNFQAVSSDGKTIYFDLDSTRIQPEALDTIRQHAQNLTSSGARVTLYGHTDEQGSTAYNQSLGERRNLSVARALASYGVSANQISTVSYGEARPAVRGSTEAAYMKNRRVEISY